MKKERKCRNSNLELYEKLDEEDKFEDTRYFYFIQFSEELINDLIDGCGEFFKEYCALVFNENYQEAESIVNTY